MQLSTIFFDEEIFCLINIWLIHLTERKFAILKNIRSKKIFFPNINSHIEIFFQKVWNFVGFSSAQYIGEFSAREITSELSPALGALMDLRRVSSEGGASFRARRTRR